MPIRRALLGLYACSCLLANLLLLVLALASLETLDVGRPLAARLSKSPDFEREQIVNNEVSFPPFGIGPGAEI